MMKLDSQKNQLYLPAHPTWLAPGAIVNKEIILQIIPQPLFPSSVWSTLFDDREAFNATLLELVYRMREQDPKGVNNTNV